MENWFPLLLAAVVGFSHAFEIDHLIAVSSLVTRRQTLAAALKDGIYWGLGHTSTIMLVGMAMLLLKVAISESVFGYLEAGVGIMLIGLGIHRLWKIRPSSEKHAHMHEHGLPHSHKVAYGVGLVHGLAGSGALVLLVMSQLKSTWASMAYLLIFGAGSIAGMLLASGAFSLPFSRNLQTSYHVRWGLSALSGLLCIALGGKIVWQNLHQIGALPL